MKYVVRRRREFHDATFTPRVAESKPITFGAAGVT